MVLLLLVVVVMVGADSSSLCVYKLLIDRPSSCYATSIRNWVHMQDRPQVLFCNLYSLSFNDLYNPLWDNLNHQKRPLMLRRVSIEILKNQGGPMLRRGGA